MIDNLKLILPFLQFTSEDDFYYLQILQRKKENPQLGSNSRVIKNYYIRSVAYLEEHYDEIKKLCEVFNARASIRLNKRSYYKTAFKSLENMAGTMANKDFNKLMKSYDRACGQGHNDPIKKWIIDIDKDEIIWIPQVIFSIQNCEPSGNKILAQIPSKTGIHLITSSFNVEQFKNKFSQELEVYQMENINLEIHKDNPTNLYIS